MGKGRKKRGRTRLLGKKLSLNSEKEKEKKKGGEHSRLENKRGTGLVRQYRQKKNNKKGRIRKREDSSPFSLSSCPVDEGGEEGSKSCGKTRKKKLCMTAQVFERRENFGV